MTRGDNRHELLVVLTPGHFTVIFNRQECGIRRKPKFLSQADTGSVCSVLVVCQISELLVF